MVVDMNQQSPKGGGKFLPPTELAPSPFGAKTQINSQEEIIREESTAVANIGRRDGASAIEQLANKIDALLRVSAEAPTQAVRDALAGPLQQLGGVQHRLEIGEGQIRSITVKLDNFLNAAQKNYEDKIKKMEEHLEVERSRTRDLQEQLQQTITSRDRIVEKVATVERNLDTSVTPLREEIEKLRRNESSLKDQLKAARDEIAALKLLALPPPRT